MAESRIFLGTEDGVRLLRQDRTSWQITADGLRGQKVWAVAVRQGQPATYMAGTYGHGLYRSEDDGVTWQPSYDGLSYGHIRAIAFDPGNGQNIYVGTEPAAMFRSDDGGLSWRELEAIQQLPGASEWFLPYSPRRGAIRSIVIMPSTTETIYGGIEQGGVILSRDSGKFWELLGGGVHPDIHQLLLSSVSPARIYAATGGGLYRSDDGGRAWVRLIPDYTRAIWQDPSNPSRIWAGPAKRVGALGTVLRSDDGGDTWNEAATGMATPMSDMVEKFVGPFDRSLLAVTSGGRLLCTELEIPSWAELLPLPGVHIMTAALA